MANVDVLTDDKATRVSARTFADAATTGPITALGGYVWAKAGAVWTTGSSTISAVDIDGYTKAAVSKILAADVGPREDAPEDPDALIEWLNTP